MLRNRLCQSTLLLIGLLVLLTACSAEPIEDKVLITHSDQPKPTSFPADVEYEYIIKDGYKLPHDNMLVTFKWHQNGSYSRQYWMYQVKEKDGGYSVLDTDHEGFYVDDVTEFDYSPVSELTDGKGSFTIRVESEGKYENPVDAEVHLFEEILVKENSSTSDTSNQEENK